MNRGWVSIQVGAMTLVSATLLTGAVLAQQVTYACVEERSVGWEPRQGQEDVSGSFAPSPTAKIMAFTPVKISDRKVVRLGELAVTEDGKTYTYVSNVCANIIGAAIHDQLFGARNDLDYYLKQCADRFAPDYPLKSAGYGLDIIRYYFSADPITLQTPISYSMSMLFGTSMAYASRGTCTLIQ